ncbi:MAG: acyltransferase domain-containing protein [Proteobacteria bacterium]|nr:acyltransferase domain-containing protein [Pseudomonadota bacterium]
MSRYDIAVVGMGCILPGANNVEQYWKNILSDDVFFKKMPQRLWHMDNFYSADRSIPEKSYTMTGAFIEDFEFPFLDYKLPPNTMKGVDPAQLLTLEATREALTDAGVELRSEELVDAITIIGSSGVDQFAHSTAYLKRHTYLKKLRPLLKAGGVDEDAIDALQKEFEKELKDRGHAWNAAIASVGAIPSSVSNRVAQVFGIKGYNMTVDAACASSFVALDTACQALIAGDARIAVAGGADLGTNPAIYVGFCRVDGLSLSGNSNPFDHTADGLIIGEGVGIVVLKRLEDALADGDRIRTVIRAVGSSSDGAGQAIYAPSVDGRAEALITALKKAEMEASEVQYLEAHATSTVVGDANEYDAISSVYGPKRDINDPLRLGSVKQQIGHLKAAAGVAGFIKTVLAMENGTLPHMPRFTKLTPLAEQPSPALVVPSVIEDWKPRSNGKRIAAVTSSGFGGVNYHFILEQSTSYDPPPRRPKVARDIAVVGIACRVAGADTVDGFWNNLKNGTDVFTKVDAKDLGWEHHFDVGPRDERITTRVVAKIADYKSDLLRHKIFPNAVSQIAPTQFLGLDLADRLLSEAGLELAKPKKIGVSIGAMHDDYFPQIFLPLLPEEYADAIECCPLSKQIDAGLLKTCLTQAGEAVRAESPPVTEHTLPGWMTNVIAGRIANKLNLCGPNFTVDSACSSGLAALLPAVYQLMFGDVDMMVSGGLNQQLSDTFTSGVCALGAVAEEIPRPYDAAGKGFLIGEGGVFYLLKRLDDAESDGDDIIAVIHSVSGSSEADSKSMVAPSEEAVRRSIRNTLAKTDVKPEEIAVVDTHGSANLLSDLVEARSIARELRKEDSNSPVQITAVKSHIGHIYGGSGSSSLFSTIQSLRTGIVPGIRYSETPRPEIDELSNRAQPRFETAPLAAGINVGGANSLGLGGANYFAVVSVPKEQSSGGMSSVGTPGRSGKDNMNSSFVRMGDEGSSDIFVCVTQREQEIASALGRALQQSPIPQFVSEGTTPIARLSVTFKDQGELRDKLSSVLKMLQGGHSLKPLESKGVFTASIPPDAELEKLAFCFPGQGTQYITMGRHLYDENSKFRNVLDQVNDLALTTFDFDLLAHIYGDENDVSIKKALGTLAGAQIATFSVEMGMAAVLEDLGAKPDVLIGHSFGEIAALTVAGVWDIETAFKVVAARIRAPEQIIKGGGPAQGMMSVICSDDQRDALLNLVKGKVVLTNINAPGRFIFAGQLDAIKQTVAVAESFGVDARRLPIGAAFHSNFMEPAREPFRQALAKLPCSVPKIPVLSTVTGEYIDPNQVNSESLADHLSGQLITPLNLPREVMRLYQDGVRHFLEVGPGWAMTKMVTAILEGKPFRAAPTLHPKVGDDETFRRARAFLMALCHLDSAAVRQNLPGMFSPDFVGYLETNEPAVVGLIEEVHKRYLEKMHSRAVREIVPDMLEVTSIVDKQPQQVKQQDDTPPPSIQDSVQKDVKDKSAWIERVRQKLVNVTGYPPEMLEEHLDLEADLGVDSVQRAEIWLALTTEHNLDTEARPKGIRTIAQLAESLAELSNSGDDPVSISTPATAKEVLEAVSPDGSPDASSGTDIWVERVRQKLVNVTGYPPEMLEQHLDLEADLGVDSVQRAEIWLALTTEYNLDTEARPKGIRTIAQLAESLAGLGGGEAGSVPQEVEAVQSDSDEDICQLFISGSQPLSDSSFEPFSCANVLCIIGEKDKWENSIKTIFSERGINVSVLRLGTLLKMAPDEVSSHINSCDTLLYLAHRDVTGVGISLSDLRQILTQEVSQLFKAFRLLASALGQHPVRVIVPVTQDGAFGVEFTENAGFLGAFPAGFVRSVARELPDCRFQLIDTGKLTWLEAIEQHIDVLSSFLEIGMTSRGRVTPTLCQLTPTVERKLSIGTGDLVLVTGGARGIVFECVLAMAQKTGCRLLLTGRTLEPADDAYWLNAKQDELSQVIRQIEIDMVRKEHMPLGDAKRKGAEIKRQWELSHNLKRLERAGIEFQYDICDVTDIEEFGAFIKSVSSEEVIRGIVHGAGVQQSRLIGELEDSAIARTVETKLSPFITLLETLDWSQLRLLIGFGSITGLFGNAGQTDYALANDLLGWMIKGVGAIHPHLNVQIIDWTAWVGTGMVSEEEAKRFVQIGLKPLDVKSGVSLFLDGIAGSTHQRLAALNASAGLAAGRQVVEFPVVARPRSRLLDSDRSEVIPTARFSMTRDVFLSQHLVEGAPVVPGTFVSEIFFESISDKRRDLCDIRFRRPLWVREEGFEVEVLSNKEELILVPAKHPELAEKGLSNLSFASCRSSASKPGKSASLKFEKQDLDALLASKERSGPPFYDFLDEHFSHALKTGPIFRGISATVERDDLFFGSVTLTDEAAWSFEIPGNFVFNPVLADMAVQVACALAMKKHRVMAIPFEIGRLHVAGETSNRDAIVICRPIDLGDEKTVVDLAIRELDGRLVLSMDRLVLSTISKAKGKK